MSALGEAIRWESGYQRFIAAWGFADSWSWRCVFECINDNSVNIQRSK